MNYEDLHIKLYNKDCRSMGELADESVQMVCTSPPYWGLRKYSGEQELIWGDGECEHNWEALPAKEMSYVQGNPEFARPHREHKNFVAVTNICSLCGAWKGAYGLEPTPEMYIEHTIEILREIRRVLRKDGVVFWNIGDSYAASGGTQVVQTKNASHGLAGYRQKTPTVKPKDLCLIPFRVAIAAQEDGWWVRSVIIWSKPNPMPESVTDRPTNSHEYVLMMTKSPRYYFDQDAVREAPKPEYAGQSISVAPEREGSLRHDGGRSFNLDGLVGRNIRSVWEFNEDEEQGGNFYKVLQGCPIHSPLLHPDILKMVSDGEPQDCLLSHTFDKYGCLVPVLSSSLSAKIFHTSEDAHLSKLGFHHHETSLWQIAESIGDNKKLALCSPAGGHLSYPETISHTKNTETNDELLACSSDYSYHADGLIATLRSKEIRKTVSLIATNDSVFLQCPDRTARTLQSLGCICSYNYYNKAHFPLSSVWSFSTQPFKDAHFAVFPEKLPELCIKAATPEVGCCSKCGAPWERVTKRESYGKEGWAPAKKDHTKELQGSQSFNREEGLGACGFVDVETLGWQPTCKCNADRVPSIVLDPFSGSATTLAVAKRLGRHAVGYELSSEYCKLAQKRVEAVTAPMLGLFV